MSSERPTTPTISAQAIAQTLGLNPPTPQQQAVIEAPLQPALVVAGAGSGKTETMANRVVWLLANERVRASDILGLTFTRKAAGELSHRVRERIDQLVAAGLLRGEYDPFDAPDIATYNSFANALFRQNALVIGREPDATLLSEASAWQLVRRIVAHSSDDRFIELDRGIDTVTSAVLSLSHALSENVVDPSDVVRMVDDFSSLLELPIGGNARKTEPYAAVRDAISHVSALPALVDCAVQFAAEKSRRGFVEYSDQVACALEVCATQPKVIEEYRRRYRFVVLDEYQDTSVVQTRLLATLFRGTPVMAVGDPHQSIYGWRGASAAGLARFTDDFAEKKRPASHFFLSTSWRNPAPILHVANTLVAPLSAKSPIPVHELQPGPRNPSSSISCVYEQTIDDEAEAVAAWFTDRLDHPTDSGTQPSAALLCRSIKRIAPFTEAFARHGVRFHVLGLGGLLDQPVIADLVSALRVMHNPTADSELVRLLAGARWRIGPKDIVALRTLAGWLASRDYRMQHLDESVRAQLRQSVQPEEAPSLVDALDFLTEAADNHRALAHISEVGRARMRKAGLQLSSLRSRVGLDLVDLITVVQQDLGLDIEVAANEVDQLGQPSLDAFREQAIAYTAVDDQPTLGAFLAWLEEAEKRDNLAPRSENSESGTVQILTIHGAKGLEWDSVAIPRMVTGEFPSEARNATGWLSLGVLPNEFRGDSSELPVLDWRGVSDQKELVSRIEQFKLDNATRHLEEQRRLIYVAVTRTRRDLLLSGSYWSVQTRPRLPGTYLNELVAAGVLPSDALPQCDDPDTNPRLSRVVAEYWPKDPLGSRRSDVVRAAEAVRVAEAQGAGSAGEWDREIDLLLAERRSQSAHAVSVRLPSRIPASAFKDFVNEPDSVAAALRRPMPERPYRQTRVGTLFHQWVEDRYGVSGGSGDELDSLPFERDESLSLDDERLDDLQRIFEASEWGSRAPEAVELEIHVLLAGQVIVCKLDAVFRSVNEKYDYQIVDWKTGKMPRDHDDLVRKQFQLALYRLAFSQYVGADPERVDAVFYFVADDVVIRPEKLYTEQELGELWLRMTNSRQRSHTTREAG